MMADAENILNNDEFFADIVDRPKKGVQQYKKRECLKSAINKGKALVGKKQWTHKRVDKTSNKTINKTYTECKQRKLNGKDEKRKEKKK